MMRTPIVLAALLAASALGQVPETLVELSGNLGPARNVVVPQAGALSLAVNPGVAVESVEARVALAGQTARTTVQVNLRNSSSRPDDAVLLVPVPPGAVVSGFTFEGSASEPAVEVLAADEARRVYDGIVAKTMDPALLEFAGYGLIRSSVFPVPAQGTQKVRVSYEHLLERDGNRIDYVLPRSESLQNRHPWTVQVEIVAERPISTVYSPSHEVIAERVDPKRFEVRLADRAQLDPGAFRISYLLEGESGLAASLFAYPDPEVASAAGRRRPREESGYFLLLAGLPAHINDLAGRIRREVTVVIDRSGSMAGPKMDQAWAAALQVIEGLSEGEAFNIIDYATSVGSFAPAPVVKDARTAQEARSYLASLRAVGGTNIHDALLEALRQEPVEGMLPIVLFLTDGLPTIGRTRETEIRKLVENDNPHKRRVFTFGVGSDVNAPLLDRIAEVTRATSSYVLPGADVEVEVARVFRRLYGPVLAAPTLDTLGSGGELSTRLVGEVIPRTMPDLFDGDQVVLLGQYRSGSPITFRVRGNFLGRDRTFTFAFDPSAASTRHDFVPRLWASRRIAELIDQVRQDGADQFTEIVPGTHRELVDEIVRLSTRFGILTEYTSFLVREGTDLADFESLVMSCGTELHAKAIRKRWGTAALNQSLNVSRQKGQARLNFTNAFVDDTLRQVEFDQVQQLCDRAFFRRGNRWVDSRLIEQPEPTRVVILGSPEHAALLDRFVGERRQALMSLKGEILLEVDGEPVLVKDGC
ncbi:MAG: VIT domain-containing protein [Planctomycetota bacterium]|jgi:Ca-activated chloride channel family protein